MNVAQQSCNRLASQAVIDRFLDMLSLTQVSLEMVLMDLLAVYGQWLEITLER